MTLTFNAADLDELDDQALGIATQNMAIDEFEKIAFVPELLGRGYMRKIEICTGIWIEWAECNYHQDWLLEVPVHDHLVQSLLLLKGGFLLSDNFPTFDSHRSYFSGSGISPAYRMHYAQGQSLMSVEVHLLPSVFEVFLQDMTNCPQTIGKIMLKQNDWKVSFFPKMTTELTQIAQQLFHTPFHGSTRRLYLQEKVWQMLKLQLQPILQDQRLCNLQSGLKTETIVRLYHAKEILLSRLNAPPDLFDLAKQVGVSDRTLQRGFRDLFGKTVVGYLIEQRLHLAEQLLRQKQFTVAEVANQVGYSHLGHFARRFKQQFGINPSQCVAGSDLQKAKSGHLNAAIN